MTFLLALLSSAVLAQSTFEMKVYEFKNCTGVFLEASRIGSANDVSKGECYDGIMFENISGEFNPKVDDYPGRDQSNRYLLTNEFNRTDCSSYIIYQLLEIADGKCHLYLENDGKNSNQTVYRKTSCTSESYEFLYCSDAECKTCEPPFQRKNDECRASKRKPEELSFSSKCLFESSMASSEPKSATTTSTSTPQTKETTAVVSSSSAKNIALGFFVVARLLF